jgi:hypothetical protein
LKPKIEVMGTVTVRARTVEMTVPVPIFQKNRWQQIVFDALPDPPFTVTQTGPLEFKAVYGDEIQTCKVRFVVDDVGEEHAIRSLRKHRNPGGFKRSGVSANAMA